MDSSPPWVTLIPNEALILGFLPLERLERLLAYDARVGNLCEVLRERHCQTDLRLPHAARLVGSNKDHLNFLIKTTCGLTFNSLLNLYRVNRAVDLIWTKNLSLTEIYLICGYNSPTTFVRQFRRWIGCNPSELRRKRRRRPAIGAIARTSGATL